MALEFEKAWEAYPADRRRDRTTSLRRMQDALSEISADELLAAVQAYAVESMGFTRSKVSFSDNWLREGKWRRHVDDLRREKAKAEAARLKELARVAEWVRARDEMCRYVSKFQISAAIERGLLSQQDAHAAGFQR